MAARIIDGKLISTEVKERIAAEVAEYVEAEGRTPTLATVIVGDDPASHIYVANKHKACEQVGINSAHHGLDADTPEDELVELVASLGIDDSIDGILVQLPVPGHINPDVVVGAINPAKDVDGLTPVSAGLLSAGNPGLVPCTPAGVIEMLDHEGVELSGAEAVVVGRSNLVGKPVAALLLARNATVTICHSRTKDLPGTCSRADVLVAAVGASELLGADCVKPGATVIDVGMNRTDDGLKGDVDFAAASEVAGAITPVPGGVGPMTIAMLMSNTLAAARAR